MTNKFTKFDEVIYVTDPTTQKRVAAVVRNLPSASTDIYRWSVGYPSQPSQKRLVACNFLNKIFAISNFPQSKYVDYPPEGYPSIVNRPLWVSDSYGVNWTGSYYVNENFQYLDYQPWSVIQNLAVSEELEIIAGTVKYGNNSYDSIPYLGGVYRGGAVYSYDGFNWYSGSMDGFAKCSAMTYSPSLQRFVAVGSFDSIWHTDNGIHWKQVTSSRNVYDYESETAGIHYWSNVTWDVVNEKFVACGLRGISGFSNATGSIMTSSDGINWNIKYIPNSLFSVGYNNASLLSVAANNGTIVVVSPYYIVTSTNGGDTWTATNILDTAKHNEYTYSVQPNNLYYASELNKFYLPYARQRGDTLPDGSASEPQTTSVPYLYFLTSSNGLEWGKFKTKISDGLCSWYNSTLDGRYAPDAGYGNIMDLVWSSDLNGLVAMSSNGSTFRSDSSGLFFTSSFESDIASLEFITGSIPNESIYSTVLSTYTGSVKTEYMFEFDTNVTQWIEFDLNRDGGDPYGSSGFYRSTASLGIVIDSASLEKFKLINSDGVEDVTPSGIRYLRENGMSYEDNYLSGLFGPSARISNGKFIPASNMSFTFTTIAGNGSVSGISNQLLGPASLTLSETPTFGDNNYGYWEINLPFPIDYNGTTYNTIYVSTCSHITFESGFEYPIYNATYTNQNKLLVSSYDNYCYRIYYGQEGNTFRIRWEGNSESDESGTSKIWEMTFYQNTSNQIDLHMGPNPNVVAANTYQFAYYESLDILTLTSASTSTFSASLKTAGRDYVSMWYGISGDYVDDEVGMILNLKDGVVIYQEDALFTQLANYDQQLPYYGMTNGSYGLIFVDPPKLVDKTNGYWELSFKVGYNSYAGYPVLYAPQTSTITQTDSILPYVYPTASLPPRNAIPPIDPFSVITSPTPEYWWRADYGLTTSSWTAYAGGINFNLFGVNTASSATGVFFSSSGEIGYTGYVTSSFGSSSALLKDLNVKHLFLRADNIQPRGAIFGGTANNIQELLFFLTVPNNWIAIEYTKSNAANSTYVVQGLRTGSKLTALDFSGGQYDKLAWRVDDKIPYDVDPQFGGVASGKYTEKYTFPSGSKILLGRRQSDELNSFAQLYIKEIAIFTSSISVGEAYKLSKEMMERWP